MDQEQINAIKKRLAKTSVGPWIVVEEEFIQNVSGVVGAIHFSKDAHFIAHARKDVPALVAEVEYLRGMLRDTRKIVRQKVKEVKTLQNACKNHKAKQEALEFHLKVSIHHAEELDVELEAEVTENEQLRKALEFYAEETKYERVELCDGDKEIYIERDSGEIARQALKGEARI